MNNKVVLIGCGNVGMAYAYSLMNQRTPVTELALIDLNTERVSGEVLDLNHCNQFADSKMKVKVGSYEDCKDAKIVVISAGANQNVGETRMDLINKNNQVFKSIIDKVMENNFNGIIIVATNPLDVMTYITLKYSNLSPTKVIGTGTTLDTARLRYILSEKIGISTNNIEAYVIGEHGDSEFIPWSNASIALKNIKDFLNEAEMTQIEEEVRNSAYEIINKKGATAYGIGMCLTGITNAILEDKNIILTVSSYDEENEVCFGGPTVINKDGVKEKLFIPLNEEETKKLIASIKTILFSYDEKLKCSNSKGFLLQTI